MFKYSSRVIAGGLIAVSCLLAVTPLAVAQQGPGITPERRKAIEVNVIKESKGKAAFNRLSSEGKFLACLISFRVFHRDETVPGPYKLLVLDGELLSYFEPKGPSNFQIYATAEIIQIHGMGENDSRAVKTDLHFLGLAFGNKHIEEFRDSEMVRDEKDKSAMILYFDDQFGGEMTQAALGVWNKGGPTVLVKVTEKAVTDHRINLEKLAGGKSAVEEFYQCYRELPTTRAK